MNYRLGQKHGNKTMTQRRKILLQMNNFIRLACNDSCWTTNISSRERLLQLRHRHSSWLRSLQLKKVGPKTYSCLNPGKNLTRAPPRNFVTGTDPTWHIYLYAPMVKLLLGPVKTLNRRRFVLRRERRTINVIVHCVYIEGLPFLSHCHPGIFTAVVVSSIIGIGAPLRRTGARKFLSW